MWYSHFFLRIQNLTNIPPEKLENYLLIVSAIEQNLVEAKKIQAEIVQVTHRRSWPLDPSPPPPGGGCSLI